MKTKIKGSVLAFIGYVLSPLSWWNDLYVNIPIAYVFALAFSFFDKSLFGPVLVVGYWLTNVAGFVLLHRGVTEMYGYNSKRGPLRSEILFDIFVSLGYTVLVVGLLSLGWLKPLDLKAAIDWLG